MWNIRSRNSTRNNIYPSNSRYGNSSVSSSLVSWIINLLMIWLPDNGTSFGFSSTIMDIWSSCSTYSVCVMCSPNKSWYIFMPRNHLAILRSFIWNQAPNILFAFFSNVFYSYINDMSSTFIFTPNIKSSLSWRVSWKQVASPGDIPHSVQIKVSIVWFHILYAVLRP